MDQQTQPQTHPHQQSQHKAPKLLILAFITSWMGPLITAMKEYVQEPQHQELVGHIPGAFDLFLSFEERVKEITTISQLKDFEREFFSFICTVNDKNIIALWNESIKRMSKFVVKYNKGVHYYCQHAFHIPRHILLKTLLESMLSTHVDEDVRSTLSDIYYKFGFTAPEFNERMEEHIHALGILVKTKCANTELAEMHHEFCQQVTALKSEYESGF
jgi:hypothetical protein